MWPENMVMLSRQYCRVPSSDNQTCAYLWEVLPRPLVGGVGGGAGPGWGGVPPLSGVDAAVHGSDTQVSKDDMY